MLVPAVAALVGLVAVLVALWLDPAPEPAPGTPEDADDDAPQEVSEVEDG